MFNVATIKTKSIYCGVALTILASCGGNNKNAESANNLLSKAQEELNNSQPEQSIILVDSLKNAFPTEIEIQRKGLHLRKQAEEKIISKEMLVNDSILSANIKIKDSYSGDFTFIKTPQMVEGYYVLKSANNRPLIQRTGIEARIDERGGMYIISLLYGKDIKHTQLSVSAKGIGEVKTENVPYNKSTNYRFKNEGIANEMITFNTQQCDSLNQFIVNNKDASFKLNFIGNSKHSIPLSSSDKKMLIDTYTYSNSVKAVKDSEGKKIYFDNKLKIAKEQINRTSPK